MPSSPVLLHIYSPHPLSCCIYTALILCLAAYILPSSSVLLHIYCPHPLSCCIYTALILCLAAYILPSSSTSVLLHTNILPSFPVLLHSYIHCTCFSTFWHCHPYILQQFNGNVFTTPLFSLIFRCIETVVCYIMS